ncbi:MAG: hypothetical protein K2X74_06185 [Acetobacteraceae bacterium]|nr:hypothetical protein [Acetobacteraceae bacterium]
MAPRPKVQGEDIRAQVAKRLVELPPVPEGFDPLAQDDRQLAIYGIPPRPDENADPAAHALWQEAVAPPMRFLPVRIADIGFDFSHRLVPANSTGAEARSGSRMVGSRNWSGALIMPERGRRFSGVMGSWRTSAHVAPMPLRDGDYRASVWIGLDGFFRRSKSLPQCGVTQSIKVVGGAAQPPEYMAWFQWWERDQLAPPIEFPNYPVKANDRIICILSVNPAANTVNILIANLNNYLALPILYTGDNLGGWKVEGSTAEWVVERPSDLDHPEVMYPLPDYGQILFTGCVATQSPDPPPTSPGSVPEGLPLARPIRMRLLVESTPPRSAIISAPKDNKVGTTSLRMTYRAP